MPTEQEYINYKDFVESLDEATPSASDKVVFNDANGPKGSLYSVIANSVLNLWAAFVNALTAKTSFVSGDKIPVVNGNTATAMEVPKLLKLTAQNALAGNVAQDFSSLKNYRNGDFCVYGGHHLRATHNISAGEFVSDDWEIIDEDSATKVRITSTNVSSYNDVNNFPVGYSVECVDSSLLSSISHKPSNELFSCYTFKARSYDINTQIAVTASKKTFIRSCFGTWGNWIEIDDLLKGGSLAPLFDSSKNYGVGVPVEYGSELYVSTRPNTAGAFNSGFWAKTNLFSFGKLRLASGNVSYYNDINNYPLGSSISCLDASLAASVSHKPVEDTFVCFTLNSRESDANVQIFVGNTDKRIFIRSCFGTWGNWIEIKSQSESASINPLSAFDNFVCIGDSLTYCAVYTGENTVRQAYKTWPDILANACDATSQSIAVGGDDAITSWGRVQTDLVAKTNALAIVYLGTNLGLTDTLSTDAPENTQYDEWADTETGCYAKIVAKAQDLGYKVLLIKPWNSSGNLAVTQKVVDDVGARFGCCVIGPFHTDEIKYHYWPNLQDTNHTHYNDLGYAWFASVLPSEVAAAPSNQLKYIIPS